MIKALFCIFSVFLGIYAIVSGVQSLSNIQWQIDTVEVQYTEPPFIAKKELTEKSFENSLIFEKKPIDIQCYSYEDFLNNVEQYKNDRKLNIDVKETSSLREGIIQSAVASGNGIRINYEPSLLIVLNGYGTEELIMEMERENDQRFLRLVLPHAQYSKSIAKSLRQMGLPYALNNYGLTEQKRKEALQECYFPRYSMEISKPSATFDNALSSDELQLKMKGIIYDALIESYENGWETVVFDATIKNLKALQSVLDEMMPLPIQLVHYPLWRDEE
ncbi:MAG: hypothetical protein ACOC34_02820 [Thermotogota bacterium]